MHRGPELTGDPPDRPLRRGATAAGGRRRLAAGAAELEVDHTAGGRWTSLRVAGLELLSEGPVGALPEGVRQGCFVMAPFAGRMGRGRLEFEGRAAQLPLTAPPHGIHGTVYDVPWTVLTEEPSRLDLQVQLADPWPFAGSVRQELVLTPDRLTARLVLHADDAMPAVLGYHPWFARRLAHGGELDLAFAPVEQYVRGPDGLPTGERTRPRPGPYDDCFRGTTAPVRLSWPGALELVVASSAEHWVVFDERPEVLCVEPQTGPPDAVALGEATVVPAGGELVLEVALCWTVLSRADPDNA